MSCLEWVCGTIIATVVCVGCRDCVQYRRIREPIQDERQVYHMEIEMVPVTTDMIRVQDNLKVVVLTDNDIIN